LEGPSGTEKHADERAWARGVDPEAGRGLSPASDQAGYEDMGKSGGLCGMLACARVVADALQEGTGS